MAKEQCRANFHGLLFQKIPKLLTSHIVLKKVRMLNFFPAKGVILDSISPKNIMSGKTLDFKKHLLLHMGQQWQVHEEESPLNCAAPITKGGIYLGPSGNLKGGYKSM